MPIGNMEVSLLPFLHVDFFREGIANGNGSLYDSAWSSSS